MGWINTKEGFYNYFNNYDGVHARVGTKQRQTLEKLKKKLGVRIPIIKNDKETFPYQIFICQGVWNDYLDNAELAPL